MAAMIALRAAGAVSSAVASPEPTYQGVLSMRAFDGQRSDSRPNVRSLAAKVEQLREIERVLAAMKPHASPTLRESMEKKRSELRAEIKQSAPASGASGGSTGKAAR